ncbi:MAG: M20/M25/M40 family metallo-hydrolase [Thermoplasmata archaeon]
MGCLDDEYAMQVTAKLVNGGRIVTGTAKSYETALWIRDEMINEVGLSPDNVYLEEFPVVTFELDEATAGDSVGYTSLRIKLGEEWVRIPAAQCSYGMGTNGETWVAEIVDVKDGKLERFERLAEGALDGKIVLFTRTDLMFYGTPVLQMAADRGAIAALCHFPVVPDDALKIDVSDEVLPMVYITDNDAAMIRSRLSSGPVMAELIIDNHWTWEPVKTGHNVIGFIPGTEHPDEYVYLGAHFDHWFTSAADDNAGVGSLLAIAKAIVDSGLKPKRTLVFVAFDSEEMGGWSDSWYDWCIGSYSHIVKALDGRVLNGDRPGKIVAMYNMDVIGADGTVVYLETTPDLTTFVKKTARDSGLVSTLPTYVYWPPSSYDDWPFYMAGVPCAQIAFWGPTYDGLYHTTADTLDRINWNYVHVNMVFNGLCVIRTSQATIHPYNLYENIEAIREDFDTMVSRDPETLTRVDLSCFEAGLMAYQAQVDRLYALTEQKNPKVDANRLNEKMRQAALVLNPKMFDWDYTAWIPGWTGIGVFDNPSNDLYYMKAAVGALKSKDGKTALKMLEHVATMQWGAYVDYGAYLAVLEGIYYIQPEHQLWAYGFMPPITDVHLEYESIMAKIAAGNKDFSMEISSLNAKLSVLYDEITEIATELGQALMQASAILNEV